MEALATLSSRHTGASVNRSNRWSGAIVPWAGEGGLRKARTGRRPLGSAEGVDRADEAPDFALSLLAVDDAFIGGPGEGPYGVGQARGRVFADLWDLDRFSSCAACFPRRLDRLAWQNDTQQVPARVICPSCR